MNPMKLSFSAAQILHPALGSEFLFKCILLYASVKHFWPANGTTRIWKGALEKRVQ